MKLNKDKQQTEGLSLKNRRLTQEIVQAESRLQDLCVDLTERERVHSDEKM